MKLIFNEAHGKVMKQALKLYAEIWQCNLKEINNHPSFKEREYVREFVDQKWTEIEVVLKVKVSEINQGAYDRFRYEADRRSLLNELLETDFSTELEVDEETLSLLKVSTELFGRIGMGQLSDVAWHPVFTERKILAFDVEEAMYEIRQSVFNDLCGRGHSYGIRNDSTAEESKIAFDMYQVVRRKLAFMRKTEGDRWNAWNVDFDAPRQYSQQPLPVIETKLISKEKTSSI